MVPGILMRPNYHVFEMQVFQGVEVEVVPNDRHASYVINSDTSEI